jgi:hypothetical protein
MILGMVMSDAHFNFVKQQGFEKASPRTCDLQYPALMFQPRVIGVLVLAGVLLQSSLVFLTLSAVLWWSALMPRLNPFDRLYIRLVAVRKSLPALAWVFEALLLVALSALIFGPFCLGSYLFHLLTGNGEFAKRTLPWRRGA